MNIALYISLVLVTLGVSLVIFRIIIGPSEPDRAAGADLLLATTISLFIILGLMLDFKSMLDLLLIVSTAGFLSTLALVRLILRDEQ